MHFPVLIIFFHWVRFKFSEDLKYIQNKYSTVYLKSTHLELFNIQVTSKSLDFLCGFPPISVTSSAPHPP